MNKDLGVLFPVCDEDRKHFQRLSAELERLGKPFVVHFDHCCKETKSYFVGHRLCFNFTADDDPKSFFDESFRQRPLDILIRFGFKFALQMDADETWEKRAPEKLERLMALGADVCVARCLDFWGDEKHYRVDGPFASSTREKLFKLPGNTLKYPHPSAHAPNVVPHGKRREDAVVHRSDLHVLHWGIMSMEDAKFHKDRWDTIYTRKLGGNPYGGYEYYFSHDPVLAEFDYEEFQ